MPASVCLCNNRGGVGKTFMAFQASAALAVEHPDRKVLAVDFSIYSDLSALYLGGTVSEEPLQASVGLTVAKEKIPTEKRVESLLQALHGAAPASKGIFGSVVSKFTSPSVDLTRYAVRVADYNEEAPPNLYLIASAGRESYGEKTREYARALAPHETGLQKKRREAGLTLRKAVDALQEDFCAVVFDTDHLAGSALTRLALAAATSCVVPCPTDTAEFHRLYRTPDCEQFEGVESLFGDVMMGMRAEETLRAKVGAMIFTKVPSVKNEAYFTAGGVRCSFTPTAVMSKQMDSLAETAWSVIQAHPEYAALFEEAPDRQTFVANTFRTFKMVPDVARNVSVSNGVPIACMTSRQYTTASGISGSTSSAALESLQKEIASLV